jgi:poly(A) polymerase Pap1
MFETVKADNISTNDLRKTDRWGPLFSVEWLFFSYYFLISKQTFLRYDQAILCKWNLFLYSTIYFMFINLNSKFTFENLWECGYPG